MRVLIALMIMVGVFGLGVVEGKKKKQAPAAPDRSSLRARRSVPRPIVARCLTSSGKVFFRVSRGAAYSSTPTPMSRLMRGMCKPAIPGSLLAAAPPYRRNPYHNSGISQE